MLKDGNKGEKEEDYLVKYYFDDDPIFEISVKEFKEKVKPHIWDEQKINNFCGFSNEREEQNKSDGNNKNYNLMKICLIIFISLTFIFLITTIVLCVKLIKNNKHESRIYNSLIPTNEEEQ